MMTETSTARILRGDNPFGVDPCLDFLPEPRYDVENWSETALFFVWDPTDSVGIFIHTGRCPDDVELWWAQVHAYLPGGVLIVDRSWGRPSGNRGSETGNLVVRCEEPLKRWTLRFDGAGERTATQALGRGLSGSGAAVPMRFEVECEALGPVWDMYAAIGLDDAPFGSIHHEQTFTARGSLTVGGRRWGLNGVACRDRSMGPRDVSPIGGDAFFHLMFPESRRSVQGLIVWDRDDAVQLRTMSIHQGDRLEVLTEGTITGVADPAGTPTDLELRTTRADGQRLFLPGRVLHSSIISMIDPNTNVNGTPVDADDPLVFSEAAVAFTWPDGELGYGHLERSCRLSRFPSVAPH